MTEPIIERPTARIIVLDPTNRVLLFFGRVGYSIDPAGAPDAKGFWALPGGAIDAGETPAEAACRELLEETGIRIGDAMPLIAKRDVTYAWKGRIIHTIEHVHFTRTATTAIDTSGWQDGDKSWMEDMRWWSATELAAARDPVRPPGLLSLVARLADGDVPNPPLVLPQ